MGQCYTVEAHFEFPNNDPTEFCEIIRKEIAARQNVSAVFNLERGDLNTPFGCFKVLTCAEAEDAGEWWYADFSGSYGWECVMLEIFEEAMRVLDDGSKVVIYPDIGWEEIQKVMGMIVLSYSNDDEEEEVD